MGTLTNVRRAIVEYTYSVLNAYSSASFSSQNKVIWANTTDNRTAMPLCFLEVIDSQTLGHANSSNLVEVGNTLVEIRKERNIMKVSFTVCAQQNATQTTNLSADLIAQESAGYLRFKFMSRESLSYLYFTNTYHKEIAVGDVSSIRNISMFEDTDYKFTYTFDVDFGFNIEDSLVMYDASEEIDDLAKGANMDVLDNTSDYEETDILTEYTKST